MAKGLKGKSLGAWVFLIGVVLAIILGLFGNFITGMTGIVLLILLIIGLIIGFVNVSGGESQRFLLAGAVLVIVSNMGISAMSGATTWNIGGYVTNILSALLLLFVPATVVVALKSIFVIAKS